MRKQDMRQRGELVPIGEGLGRSARPGPGAHTLSLDATPFHPGRSGGPVCYGQREEGRFEVANPAIRKDSAWIDDVVAIFSPDAKLLQITKGYPRRIPAWTRTRCLRPWKGSGFLIGWSGLGFKETMEDER